VDEDDKSDASNSTTSSKMGEDVQLTKPRKDSKLDDGFTLKKKKKVS
jgi:hypothetical protein